MSKNDNDNNTTTMEMIICSNCGHNVPLSNIPIHQAICGKSTATVSCQSRRGANHTGSSESNFNRQEEEEEEDEEFHVQSPPRFKMKFDSNAATITRATNHTNNQNTNTNKSHNTSHNRNPEIIINIDSPSPPKLNNPNDTHTRKNDEIVNLADDDDDDDEEEMKSDKNDQDKNDDVIVEEWSCPQCTLLNNIQATCCDACGYFNPRNQSNHDIVRDPDRTQREQLLSPTTTSSSYYYYHTNSNQMNRNNNNNNNNLMRNVGQSALLGSAIGALSGYTHNRNLFNSALEGAVAGAVGGVLSNHFHNNATNHTYFANDNGNDRRRGDTTTTTTTSFEGRSPLGFSYRISRSRGGNNDIPLDIIRMITSSDIMGGNYHSSLLHHPNIDQMDYEQLLQVFGDGNENRQQGASQEIIDNLPTTIVQNVTQDISSSSSSSQQQQCQKEQQEKFKCSICLEHFENGQIRKTLQCLHGFHDYCIDKWLRTNASCPICKFRVDGH